MQKAIHNLRQKPDHVRRRIAIGASAGITALVGIVWLTAMTSSGAFAIGTGPATPGTASQTPSSDAFALSGTNVKSNISQLVGAVNAATGATSSQPALTIIDGGTSSSLDHQAPQSINTNPSATVLPF